MYEKALAEINRIRILKNNVQCVYQMTELRLYSCLSPYAF